MAVKASVLYRRIMEAHLLHFGNYNSSDLMRITGMSRDQARLYFRRYRQEHLPPITYQVELKKFIVLDNFKPVYIHKKDATAIIKGAELLLKE